MPVTGFIGLGITATQPTTLRIDGNTVVNDTPAGDPAFVAGQQNTVGTDVDGGPFYTGGVHQIEVDFTGSAIQLNDFKIDYTYLTQDGDYHEFTIPNVLPPAPNRPDAI